MPLRDRLALLEAAGVITARAVALTLEATKQVERTFSISLAEDAWEMGSTHLATALSRVERGQELPAVDIESLAEIESRTEELELARALVAQFSEALGRQIDQGETYLIAAHLAVARDASTPQVAS
jgi:transcriptional regulatory protein LevR